MRKMNRNKFVDLYLNMVQDAGIGKHTPIYPEWYYGHILIDSRLNWDGYDRIKAYLDGLKVAYKELHGYNDVNGDYYGIYIYNSNFRNADLLERD